MTTQDIQRGDVLLRGAGRFERKVGIFSRLVAPGFAKVLDHIDRGLATGSLRATLPDGSERMLGGRAEGFDCEVTLHDWRALLRLATNGSIGWYQAWEAGEWSSPDPVPLFALFMANAATLGGTARAKGPMRLAARVAHWFNRNTKDGAARNIRAHYDLGNDFYAAWLDETMTYSSALWGVMGEPNEYQQMTSELSYGQLGKIAAIQQRLQPRDGQKLLEIGCGWGGASAIIAGQGVDIDAISLSPEQLAWAKEALPEDLAGAVRFLERDYRDVDGQYDGIFSVEMVEALGREYWPSYMDCIARNLKPGGRAAIQYISIRDDLFDAYAASADFIQAYIFPGGLLIRTSEFRALAQERGLEWRDRTDFGQHYAETLCIWREAFDAAAAEGALPDGFDDQFVRLWRYYLMYCEGGFRGGGIDVHQVTLVKPESYKGE
ncbi:SAM-dependent methyltransferase [Alteripontixanthobacter maritimus]|nr:cyclopropane-fatty-acyl-phospholipid synthase family protein [Alteripontixanthobacter maritimus]